MIKEGFFIGIIVGVYRRRVSVQDVCLHASMPRLYMDNAEDVQDCFTQSNFFQVPFLL